MNKNTEVLIDEYYLALKGFSKIYEIKNINYTPYILNNFYKKDDINNNLYKQNLIDCFKGRSIPSWRDKLDLLLYRLNIYTPVELLDKSFGLSLSD